MPFHFQTWEFLFGFNLLLVIFYPFLANAVRSEKLLNLILFLGPALLASIENLFFKADLSFFLKLCALHSGISLFSIYALWKFIGEHHRKLKYFGFIFLSLAISLSKFLYLPSLVWIDAFWGVVPGTVSIDPIISLDPYLLRTAAVVIASMTFLSYRSAAWCVMSFWAVSLIFSLCLRTNFEETLKIRNIEINLESKKASSFSPWVWAREFGFLLDKIEARLPPAARFKSKTPYKIFIYDSDDSKAAHIGARQTEIGNYVLGEMHLSHLIPGSEVLAHELAHLVHGKLEAPLVSYLDPFFLEGLAVSLASSNTEDTLHEAAAFTQVLSVKTWPKGLNFFFLLPPPISYALAGGFAEKKLESGEWPWAGQAIDIDVFQKMSIDERRLEWAKKFLDQKPLFKDPHSRDCARLEWVYSKSDADEDRSNLENICPHWKEKPTYRVPESDLKLLNQMIERVQDPDLKAAKRKFYLGLLMDDSKILAREILKSWKIPDSSEARAFKERLEWEVRN